MIRSKPTPWRYAWLLCTLTLTASLLCPFPVSQAAASVASLILRHTSPVALAALAPLVRGQDAGQSAPHREQAPRVKLKVRGTHQITSSERIVSATVLDPEKVAAELKDERTVLLKGLATGETILILSGQSGRVTYAVDVLREAHEGRKEVAAARARKETAPYSGFYKFSLSPSFGGRPALMRHAFGFRQNLEGRRVLRAEGELFNLAGRGGRDLALPFEGRFGANRIRLGLDSPAGRLDVLDSELNISPHTFNGFVLRGLHYASSAKSPRVGGEFFAGVARPSTSLFGGGEGQLAGAIIPVASGSAWRVRAGAFFVASRRRESLQREKGFIWHADARYSVDEGTTVDAEAAYANGSLSWRARLDLRRGPFAVYAESLRLSQRSPLIPVAAQQGRSKMDAASFRWNPAARFGASLSYNRTTSVPLPGARVVRLNNSTIAIASNFKPAAGAGLNFNFAEQRIESPPSSALPFRLQIQTRSAAVRYGQTLGDRWTNDFEVRFTSSVETRAGAEMSSGFGFREQLRYSRRRASIAGFISRRSNTPSLTGLVLRDPLLLPPSMRQDFQSDPAGFLLANRDLLPQLLPGVQLPLTRSTDIGVRLKSAVSRLTLSGELRHSEGELVARERRDLFTSFNVGARLDAANTLQVSGGRVIALSGAGGRSALTVSFVHRFGAGSGGGLQLSRLLGLDRGRIRGRVFTDLNGNGRDDVNEPGVAGMRVTLDGGRSVTTDAGGRFGFDSTAPGEHGVAFSSDDLGVRLRASTPTEQRVHVSARQTAHVSFGVNDFGFVAGRVFNDLLLKGEAEAGSLPGVGGVRVMLRQEDAGGEPLSRVSDAGGFYEFRNLAPGRYTLEVDAATMPADFRIPQQTRRAVAVGPLKGFYFDIALAAQRAVSGVVFVDADGDGQYDPQKDTPAEGARVVSGRAEALTDHRGAYLLRNLPAGTSELRAHLAGGKASEPIAVVLGQDPALRRNVNIAVR